MVSAGAGQRYVVAAGRRNADVDYLGAFCDRGVDGRLRGRADVGGPQRQRHGGVDYGGRMRYGTFVEVGVSI